MEKYFQCCANFSALWFLWPLWQFLCNLAQAVVRHVFLFTLSKKGESPGVRMSLGSSGNVFQYLLVTHAMTYVDILRQRLFQAVSWVRKVKLWYYKYVWVMKVLSWLCWGGEEGNHFQRCQQYGRIFPNTESICCLKFQTKIKKQREVEEEQWIKCSRWQLAIPCWHRFMLTYFSLIRFLNVSQLLLGIISVLVLQT